MVVDISQDTAPWAEPATKKQEDNPYIQAFHKWWESDLADSLEEIRITGGEPIMHKGTWKLFDWFKIILIEDVICDLLLTQIMS